MDIDRDNARMMRLLDESKCLRRRIGELVVERDRVLFLLDDAASELKRLTAELQAEGGLTDRSVVGVGRHGEIVAPGPAPG